MGSGSCTCCRSRPRCLLTGAGGFSGQEMRRLLQKSGYRVIGTDVIPRDDLAVRFCDSYVRCDLRDISATGRLVREKGPFDLVFHTAGLVDLAADYRMLHAVNVGGTDNLFRALLTLPELPRRLMLWSSGGVYDLSLPGPLDEDAPLVPTENYGRSKLESERLARSLAAETGLVLTVIRPSGIYGPGNRYGIATPIFLAARGGLAPCRMGRRGTRVGTVQVNDVARAALHLARLDEAAGGTYNVDDGAGRTLDALLEAISERLDFPVLPLRLPQRWLTAGLGLLERAATRRGRQALFGKGMTEIMSLDTFLDATRLRRTGWSPLYPDPIAGLLETIDGYEQRGWL